MARVDDNVAACGYCPSDPHVNQEPELVPSNPSSPLKPPRFFTQLLISVGTWLTRPAGIAEPSSLDRNLDIALPYD